MLQLNLSTGIAMPAVMLTASKCSFALLAQHDIVQRLHLLAVENRLRSKDDAVHATQSLSW